MRARRLVSRGGSMAVEPPRDALWPEGAGAESGFVRAVLSLPDKPDTTVRFFERGDYYTVHGADALLAARELFRTRAVIRQLAGTPGACGGRPGSGLRGGGASAAAAGGTRSARGPCCGGAAGVGRAASGGRRGAGTEGAAGAAAAAACSQG